MFIKIFTTFLFLFFSLSCRSIQLQKYIKVQTDDYAIFGANPLRTNCMNKDVNLPFNLIWKYNANAGFSKYTGCVSDSILFLPTLYGELHLINVYTGKRITKQKFSDPISGSIALSDNEVFITFSSLNTSLLCYDLTGGAKKWKLNLGEIETSPVIFGKSVFVSTTNGSLYSITKAQGIIKWSFTPETKIKKPSYSSPATDGQIVVYGCDDNYIYALDFDNGNLKWKFKTNGSIRSTPSLNEYGVFFGSTDGNFYCIDLNNGGLLWKKDFKTPLYSAQALSDSFLYISTPDGYVHCIYAFSGANIWQFYAGSNLSYAPIVTNNLVIIGCFNKNLYVLDSKNGSLLWSYQLNGRIKSQPILWRNFLIALTDNQTVYGFIAE